jgi:ketopantoate reductase
LHGGSTVCRGSKARRWTLVVEVLGALSRQSARAITSLHADFLAGRPTELDARHGVILRLGQKHGFAAPCTHPAVRLLETLPPARRR